MYLNRVSQTADGVTTNYALDTAIGLAEVIFTSEGHSYLHLPGVLMTESAGGEVRYLLADGLGSIRHVTDEAGAVVGSQEFDPYGAPLASGGEPYGYTGEWWSADVGLLHLRARWYDPASGTFLSRDAVESEPPYQYVRGNVVNLVDPSGYTGFTPGDIERSIQVSAWTTNASDDWFAWALGFSGTSHPVIADVYNTIGPRLKTMGAEFADSTIQTLYYETRTIAEQVLADQICNQEELWRESAHVALIVLAGIGRVTIDTQSGGPGFIPNPEADNPRDRQGADTGWHFLYHAFLSFELLYAQKYELPEYNELQLGINSFSLLMQNKIDAVEDKYIDTVGDDFVGSLSGNDLSAYNMAVTAGNLYEVISTYDNTKRHNDGLCRDFGGTIVSPGTMISPLQAPMTPGTMSFSIPGTASYACKLDAILDSDENFAKLLNNPDPAYLSGVQDPGVYTRDVRANHLGAQFGIQAFHHPIAFPPIP